MIRVTDNKGAVGVGLCRSYIEGLLRGERVCIPGGMDAPHICLFFAEDDDALMVRTNELWPDGLLPGATVEDHRKKTDPMSDIETQDTEPLTPDAARIVELERQLSQVGVVVYAAVVLAERWLAAKESKLPTLGLVVPLDNLAAAVSALPKG